MAHINIIGCIKADDSMDSIDSPTRRNGAGLMLAVKDSKTPTLYAYNLRFTDRGYLKGAIASVNKLGRITAGSWTEISMQHWVLNRSVVVVEDGTVLKDNSVEQHSEFNDDPDHQAVDTYKLPELTRKQKGWSLR